MHQNYLVENLNPFNPIFQQWFSGTGLGLGQEKTLALAYGLLVQQSTLSAFIDVFRMLAIACVVCIPLVALLKRVRTGAPMLVH